MVCLISRVEAIALSIVVVQGPVVLHSILMTFQVVEPVQVDCLIARVEATAALSIIVVQRPVVLHSILITKGTRSNEEN